MSLQESEQQPVTTKRSPALRVPDHPDLADLPPLPHAALRRFKGPVWRLMRTWWDVQVHDQHLVPATGPVILAANHIAMLDGPLIVLASPRPTYALAKQELFRGVVGRVLEAAGQISVTRGTADKGAVRQSLQVLLQGNILGVFPEGHRGSGAFDVAHGGAAYLAMITGAPIVPVAMLGTRQPDQTPRQVPGRGKSMHVVFGEPIPMTRMAWPRRQHEVATLTEDLRAKLATHVRAAELRTGLRLPGLPRA
ncbi:lysophospholipid acyltransferase family protein [Propionibacteriaceae bacterium Y2011]